MKVGPPMIPGTRARTGAGLRCLARADLKVRPYAVSSLPHESWQSLTYMKEITMEQRTKLLDEVHELALQNDMNYFG